VFALLKKLGVKAENIHYSYGMINLTTGKMKSREGRVVDADDFVKELEEISKVELKKRYPDLNNKEIEHRCSIIAMAAIRFFILKYEYSRDFVYILKKVLLLKGKTDLIFYIHTHAMFYL
jgi:arginyl-tRNA synthetase